MLTTLSVVVGERNYQIEELGENPGIYFERAEDVSFTKATWKVLIAIDLKNADFNEDYYKEILGKIASTCAGESFPGQCEHFANTFGHLYDRVMLLKREYGDLRRGLAELEIPRSEIDDNSRIISKRSGTLAMVGTMAKYLFGTLTDEDGRRILNHFARMSASWVKMMVLPKDQTHLISKKVTRNDEEIKTIKKILDFGLSRINATWEIIDHLTKGWEVLAYSSRMEVVINDLSMHFDELKDQYQKIREIINAAKLGQLHPELIEATQLAEIISDVKKTFPEWRFPISVGQSRSGELSRIAKTMVGYEGDQLVVQIIAPVIEVHPTEIYQIHEVPIPQEGSTSAANITSRKQNIAISFDKKRYTYMDTNDLTKCLKLRRTKICKDEGPWMDAEKDPDCEAMLLNQPSAENLKVCPITVKENLKGLWTYLKASNSWLFSVPDQTKVVVTCQEGIAEGAFIKGVGILRLTAGCSATQGKYLLRTSPTLHKTLSETYRPKLQLNLHKFGSEVLRKGRKIRQFSKFSSNDEIIESRRLEEIQGEYERLSKVLEEKELFLQNSYSLAAIGLIVLVIIITNTLITIGIFWRRRERRRNYEKSEAITDQEKQELRDPLERE